MDTSTPIRLAMRVEGDWWVAYAASSENMNDALEMARIRMGAVKSTPDAADRFKSLMMSIMAQMLTDIGATIAEWHEQPAPESERSGQA